MIAKSLKLGIISAVGLCLVGGLLFGRDLVSYVYTSAGSVRSAVKDAVPVQFDLQRARNMLDEIIPEMHANVRLVAQEEVEVAALKTDIQQGRQSLLDEKKRVEKLTALLAVQQADYAVGDRQYSRQQVKEDLARRFDHFREAQVVLAGKKRLLTARQSSLQAAMQVLERTRLSKTMLADQIGALESKYRLVRAASIGSQMQFDNSKLAQTEKLIAQIKKRLDVAERVLAHEARFIQPIEVDTIDEKELLTQVADYFAEPKDKTTEANDSIQLTRSNAGN